MVRLIHESGQSCLNVKKNRKNNFQINTHTHIKKTENTALKVNSGIYITKNSSEWTTEELNQIYYPDSHVQNTNGVTLSTE